MSDTTTTRTITEVDPRALLVDDNVRLSTSADKTLIASIREHGVLQPITAVTTAEGQLRVRYGNRRTLAAIQAGQALVPVLALTAEQAGDEVDRITRQYAENEHRAGLTEADKVAVATQLAAFGLSATQIGKRLHAKKADVAAALRVADSDLAKAATLRYDFLTLDQAAIVADHDDDTDTVKALIAAAKLGSGQFLHAAAKATAERAERQQRAVALAALVEAGVSVIDRPGWDSGVQQVSRLLDADGKAITDAEHASCPGHAAWLDTDWLYPDEPEQDRAEDEEDAVDDEQEATRVIVAVYVCTDPAANGHRDTWRQRSNTAPVRDTELSEKDRLKAKAERRTVLDNNKAWRTAEGVRRTWLTTFCARKTAPKGAAAFLALEIAHGDHAIRRAFENTSDLAHLLIGQTKPAGRASLATAVEGCSDARSVMIAVAFVLAAYESATSTDTWRNRNAAMGRYFTFLAANGYALSEVEQLVTG